MGYRRLFIWVEGEDDERFFQHILKPKLQKKYDFVETRRYVTMKKDKIDNFLKSIKAMGADYIYVMDINNSPCVSAKKQEAQNKLKNIEDDKIIVVIKEIESWYLAGISDIEWKRLKIHTVNDIVSNTNSITKEQFYSLIPQKFDSRIDFMLEVLKIFSIEIAKQKNESFKYYVEKYIYKTSGNVSKAR